MKRPAHILVVTYWPYADALIQTYTLPYLHLIQNQIQPEGKIFLVTLEKDPGIVPQTEIREHLRSRGITWIPLRYSPFGWKAIAGWAGAFIRLTYRIIKDRINIIHCWATPAGTAGYVLSVLTGRKLIIDSYEPHAEAMVENGSWKKGSIAFRLLFWFEKKQTRRADCVIAATAGMKEYAHVKYQTVIRRFYVKPACVDLGLFSIRNIKNPMLLEKMGLQDKIVCVYAGKLGGIYLEQEVFDFVKVATDHWGDRFRFLLLSNLSQEEINEYARRANLDLRFIKRGFVPHREVASYMGLADFALTPVKPVPTKRYCTPIKDGEYWALGLPVVITRDISDDSSIIEKEGIGTVLQTLDAAAYKSAVGRMDELLRMNAEERFKKIRNVAEKYRGFGIAEAVYREIYYR